MNGTEKRAAGAAYWNPYTAGVLLGLVLLSAFVVLGHGIGASGAATRLGVAALDAVAPAHTASGAYFSTYVTGGHAPLVDWIVVEIVGVFLGGVVGSALGGRRGPLVTRGPRVSATRRLAFALAGGIMMGFAARIARGCTSGQALTGGALLSAGSWIFMMCVFAGGYALARLMRRQWT